MISAKTFIFWSVWEITYLRLYKRNILTLGHAVARTVERLQIWFVSKLHTKGNQVSLLYKWHRFMTILSINSLFSPIIKHQLWDLCDLSDYVSHLWPPSIHFKWCLDKGLNWQRDIYCLKAGFMNVQLISVLRLVTKTPQWEYKCIKPFKPICVMILKCLIWHKGILASI